MPIRNIFAEEVFNIAYRRIRKASGCPVCDFCARTKAEVRKHIKEDHDPEEIVDALNIKVDGIYYKFNKSGEIVF